MTLHRLAIPLSSLLETDLLKHSQQLTRHADMTEATLGKDFFNQVDQISNDDAKIRFYYCLICNVAALNYPDLVPEIFDDAWHRVLEHISEEQQFKAAQKMREALIKACGIQGAAKVTLSLLRPLRRGYGVDYDNDRPALLCVRLANVSPRTCEMARQEGKRSYVKHALCVR